MNAMELGFFSIPVLNMEIAKSFYGNVMGWNFKDRDSQFSYIFSGEKMIGAIEQATDSFQPSSNGPLLFFRAESMDSTLANVKANSGVVKEKVAIENGARGYTAKILDPSKNAIGFWAPEN